MTVLNVALAEKAFAPSTTLLHEKRFTLDGSSQLERHLAGIVEKVRAGVLEIVGAERIEGILLAGGYGRGEGGVLRSAEGDGPYNDVEFYVFVKGPLLLNQRRFQHALHEFAERLTPEAGIEVELKVFSLEKLRASEVSMFFYDLVAGHRWVWADERVLAGCEHHLMPERIPLHEGARLLMNRCSGLLFAAEHLQRPQFGPNEADFVERNLNKLRLALGDVLLTAYGQYHWSCRERHARLALLNSGLGWQPEVVAEHAAGVQFKLRPFKSIASRETLQEQHRQLSGLAQTVWLWLENRRLGRAFGSAESYAMANVTKCPGSPPWRNLLLNLRCLGQRALLQSQSMRHPRERVINALALLLWTPLSQAHLQKAGEELCLPTRVRGSLSGAGGLSREAFAALVAQYRGIWCQVN